MSLSDSETFGTWARASQNLNVRLVMEKTDHTLLVSQGAEKLAGEEKLEKVDKLSNFQIFVSKSSAQKLTHEKL